MTVRNPPDSEFLTSVNLGVSLFLAARRGRQSRRQTLPWRQDPAGGSRRPSTDWSSGTSWARLEIDGVGKARGSGGGNPAVHSDS